MTTAQLTAAARTVADQRLRELRDALEDAFGCEFHVLDLESGAEVYVAPQVPKCDQLWQQELLAAVARQGQPQCIAEEDAVVVFALPLSQAWNLPWVVVAPFVTRAVGGKESVSHAAKLLAKPEENARHWINQQPLWPVHTLDRLGRGLLRRLRDQKRIGQLEREVEKVSSSLTSSYEEISLLHSISQNFRLSSTDEELGRLALEWLLDCIAVQGVSLIHLPVAKPNETTYPARTEAQLLSCGEAPLATAESVLNLVETLYRQSAIHARGEGIRRPLVVNHNRSELAPLLPTGIRQLIIAPMIEGDRNFGYLLAFNHTNNEELGTVEANLIASVSAMLGVHCSNRDLYRQQDEFLASVVRALTAAIDAKDPYTRGHSARVARIATTIAKAMGGDADFLGTVYMAGLLHDIGKIGIDDAVLRKPGRLTDAEFEHIKQHPGLGHRILADIKQFAIVLPAVLHHHEQWDGRGYPNQLSGDNIPYIARIIAVADAYDAMSSDRPYRPGMPEEKVRSVFNDGSGKQWDPKVIAAFFAAYNDIRGIMHEQTAPLSLDVQSWMT